MSRPRVNSKFESVAKMQMGARMVQWQGDGPVMERSPVRVPLGAAGEVSSPGSAFYADSNLGIRSTPLLPEQHIKDPGHSAKSAGGRLQLNTYALYVYGFHEVPWCMSV